jgi:KDO2-lipid IV(A) lauroyltransferase
LDALIFLLALPLLLLLSILPHPILYLVSDGLCFLLYRVFKFRLKVVRLNLELSFPDKTFEERKKIEHEFYKNLCDIFLEMAKNITISEKQIKKRFRFEGVELLNAYKKQKRSSILQLGHFSNWEGMLSIGHYLDGIGYAIYAPLSNKYFDWLIQKSRRKHHIELVPRLETINFIQKNESEGNYAMYGFISDQSPNVRPKTYWRPFLGIEVPVFTGAGRMAKKFNLPILFAEINRDRRGYYTAKISSLVENCKDYTENELSDLFLEKVEAQIRRNPSQYLWSHNRFKHRDKAPKDV